MSDLAEIRTDIRTIAVDVGALRQWCTSHESMHVSIASDIAGLEDRERVRGEATGRIDVHRRSISDAPRKGVRIDLSRVTLRDAVFLVALCASLLLGGSAALSGDDGRAELMRKMEKIARVVAEIESEQKAEQAPALPAPSPDWEEP
jgi:hypothetical protein